MAHPALDRRDIRRQRDMALAGPVEPVLPSLPPVDLAPVVRAVERLERWVPDGFIATAATLAAGAATTPAEIPLQLMEDQYGIASALASGGLTAQVALDAQGTGLVYQAGQSAGLVWLPMGIRSLWVFATNQSSSASIITLLLAVKRHPEGARG